MENKYARCESNARPDFDGNLMQPYLHVLRMVANIVRYHKCTQRVVQMTGFLRIRYKLFGVCAISNKCWEQNCFDLVNHHDILRLNAVIEFTN